jgi:Zn-dependent protease
MLNLTVPEIISRVFTLIIAFTVHEFSHAFVADRFGDNTPRLNGRLTLNPLKHLDFFGSLLLIVAGFGWAKPVPINPSVLRQRSKSAVMWVSLAGPFSNLLMAVAAALLIRINIIPSTQISQYLPTPIEFLYSFFVINLVLMVFNLFPISPLDGEKVLEFLLPQEWADQYAKLRPYGPLLLMVVVLVLPRFGIDIFSMIMNPIISGLERILLGV